MYNFKKPLTIISLLSLSAINIATAAEIAFSIDGVKNNNGKLLVALFKGETGHQSGKPAQYNAVAAKQGKVVVSFKEIKQGEYAIQVFHDENDNGKLETNLVGMPTEGYGFSNNAQPNFGPAKYSDMKFAVSNDDAVIENSTTLIY